MLHGSNLLSQNFKMVHFAINDNSSAIFHEESLMIKIIFKCRMFNWSDMIRADIKENTNVKGQTINPLFQISLTGNFHDEMSPSIFNSCRHHFEQIQAFRCCQSRFEEMFSIKRRVHGRQESWLMTLLEDMIGKISRRCLSLSSCKCEQFEFILWISIKFHGKKAHGLLYVVD